MCWCPCDIQCAPWAFKYWKNKEPCITTCNSLMEKSNYPVSNRAFLDHLNSNTTCPFHVILKYHENKMINLVDTYYDDNNQSWQLYRQNPLKKFKDIKVIVYPKPEFLNKPDVDGSSDYMPSSPEDSSKDSSFVPQQIEQLEMFNEENHNSSQVRNTSNSTHSDEYTNKMTITCGNLARKLRMVKSQLKEATSQTKESNNDIIIKISKYGF